MTTKSRNFIPKTVSSHSLDSLKLLVTDWKLNENEKYYILSEEAGRVYESKLHRAVRNYLKRGAIDGSIYSENG